MTYRLDIKKMTASIAMATERMAELNKRRDAGTLTPEYEDSMMESVCAAIQNANDLVKGKP